MVETHSIAPVLGFDVSAPPSSIQALGRFQRHILQVAIFLLLEALCDHDQVYQPRGAQMSVPVLIGIPIVNLPPDTQ